MKHIVNKNLKLLIILFSISMYSQSETHIFQSHMLDINNPAFIGLNEQSHITVLSSQSYDLQNKSINNFNFFGSLLFEDYNFFLGLNLSSKYFSKIGIGNVNSNISYTHRININNSYKIYPYVSANYSIPTKFSNLIFEDQIISGLPSIDELANNYKSKGYVDFNAGFVLKNEKYFIGIAINNLRQANTSSDNENTVRISRNGDFSLGYQKEFNSFGIFLMGSYFYRPSIKSNFTFSSYRFDEEINLNNISFNIFQEFWSNSFESGIKNLGLSIRSNFNNFDIGVGYKSPIGKKTINNENTFEVFIKYNFEILNFDTFLKWESLSFF